MDSLIPATQTWLLLAFVVAGAALSIWMEQRIRWAARIGGPVLALLLAMLLSNTRILPLSAAAYDVVDDYLVPMAIPLLLLRADLRKILKVSGITFAAFHVAALGTLVGAFLVAFVFRNSFEHVPEISGIMAGSYIGGAVNFVAIRNSYNVAPELSNPLIVADNFIMALMFAACIVIAGHRWFLARYPHPHTAGADIADSAALAAEYWKRKEIALIDIAQAFAIAVGITAISMGLSGVVKARVTSPIIGSLIGNVFVWITLMTVAVTTLARRWTEKVQGGDELGMFLLYLFFFVLGVRADFLEVVRNVPVLFVFCLMIALTNLGVVLLLGRWFRMNIEDLMLCVNASLGGAPSAAAMAISRGWSNLVLPGLLVGIWGYVIGTPLGILMVELLRKIL